MLEEHLHDLGVQVQAAGPADVGVSLLVGHGFPVGSLGGEGVEDVRHRADPAQHRDLAPLQPHGIPRAVPALVVRQGHSGPQPEDGCSGAVEDPGPHQGVLLHDGPLLRGQGTGLVEDGLRHTDLADVVEGAGGARLLQLGLLHPESSCQDRAVVTDPCDVLHRFVVLELRRQDQPLNGVQVGFMELLAGLPLSPESGL